MNKREYRKRAKLFQALAHPVRLQILELLSQGPICVCDLMPQLDQRQAYISQQLSILRKTRLVHGVRIGKRIRYELVTPVLQGVLESTLEEFIGIGVNPGPIQSDLKGNLEEIER